MSQCSHVAMYRERERARERERGRERREAFASTFIQAFLAGSAAASGLVAVAPEGHVAPSFSGGEGSAH